MTIVTDNTAVIRAIEENNREIFVQRNEALEQLEPLKARIAELEAVAEAADANNVSRILIKYANFHPQWKALADALRAAGYLSE